MAKKLAADQEAAYLSLELAAINQDVPLAVDLDSYQLTGPKEELAEEFTKLGIRTLLARLGQEGARRYTAWSRTRLARPGKN